MVPDTDGKRNTCRIGFLKGGGSQNSVLVAMCGEFALTMFLLDLVEGEKSRGGERCLTVPKIPQPAWQEVIVPGIF